MGRLSGKIETACLNKTPPSPAEACVDDSLVCLALFTCDADMVGATVLVIRSNGSRKMTRNRLWMFPKILAKHMCYFSGIHWL